MAAVVSATRPRTVPAPRSRRARAHLVTLRLAWLAGVACLPARAIDPPHATASLCASCHITHQALGADLTTALGNANLCLSCHQSGGAASGRPFAASDQALPGPGLPAGTRPAGTSHRWDAGVGGHLAFLGGAAVPSTGTISAGGLLTGAYSKTYTLTITVPGAVGVARFSWVGSTPGGGAGTNLLTGTNVPLDQGIFVRFASGPGTPFQLNDRWNLFTHAGLRPSTNATVLAHLANDEVSCSACHDEHSQAAQPFDPAAPVFTGPGSGTGRHFMRIDNQHNQLCTDCHAAHAVTNALAGSHPVGIPVPGDATHAVPSLLPLEAGNGNLGCLTCHQVHFSPVDDGKLLRLTNSASLCGDCHRQSDLATPAAHFVRTNANTLWPGGKHGSLMPARTAATDQGTCVNCHAVHGWPDAANPSQAYPKLLADSEEKLCYTCHGTDGPALKLVQADFAKARHHPVAAAEQVPGRKVECTDCHNAHGAQSGGLVYTNTATATRNRVTNPLKGVAGVAVNYAGLGNFAAPATNAYRFVAASVGATNEYEVCFKCHSAYAWGSAAPPAGQSPNGTALTPAETDLAQEFSPANRSGHPVVTGLDNYPNSLAVNGRKGLAAVDLKPPWNVNLGQQTMTCGDCHNSDATAPAAQGPHGSAAQFMLRGPNANNWPNVRLTSFTASWCANCHNKGNSRPHSEGDHQNFPCYYCHLVVPHGGKLSRLIADNDTMPSRYAYNNTLDPGNVQAFTKAAPGSYGENSCRAQCHGGESPHRNSNPNENW